MSLAKICVATLLVLLGLHDWNLEERNPREGAGYRFQSKQPMPTELSPKRQKGSSLSNHLYAIPGVFLPPKYDSVVGQFEFAKLKVKEAQQAESGKKWRRLQELAGAWNAVMVYWPEGEILCAEACFRLGEVLLRMEDSGGAFSAFQMAVDVVPESQFQIRARMQMGHIHRRSGRAALALKAYQKAGAEPLATLRMKNDALEWQGKTSLALGDWIHSGQCFRLWAKNAEGPLETIRSTDLQAQVQIRSGELLAAEILLSTLRENLRRLSKTDTPEGRKVFSALGKLRADQQLRLIRQFGASHGDGKVVSVAN